ncbi:MAG: four helix bundle protein [bacterium]
MDSKKIASFKDLEVYQESYSLSVIVMTKLIPKIPESEKFDLKDQLSRSSKAIPRLIAEGYGKKHQKAGFQKYLDDAMAETNETIVSICHCKDIFQIEMKLCDEAVKRYDVLGRRIYRLAESWESFRYKGRNKPSPTT